MEAVLTALGTMGAIAAAGWLVGRSGALGPTAQAVLARFVFVVATPALLFSTVAHAELSRLLTTGALVAALSTSAVALLSAVVVRLVLRRSVGDSAVVVLSASYLNAAILGIPIAVYLLGDAIAVVPTLMFQLLVLAPVAFAILGARVPGAVPGWRGVVGTTLRNPIIVAAIAGLLVSLAPWDLPELLYAPFQMVGAAAAPLALVAFGMSMTGRSRAPSAPEDDDDVSRAELALVVAVRTVVHPAVAYVIARALGLTGEPLLGAVTMAALPTAQNVLVYAMQYGRRTALVRAAVLTTTVLAVPLLLLVSATLH